MEKRSIRYWALVLMTCILISACSNSDAIDERDQLYAVYPNVIFDLEDKTAQSSSLRAAFQAYEKGDYVNALSEIQKLDSTLITPDVMFYAGQCYFAEENYREAKPFLITGGKHGTAFKFIAKYYIAICDHEFGRHEMAQRRLHNMIEGNRLGEITDRGKELLDYYRRIEPDAVDESEL